MAPWTPAWTARQEKRGQARNCPLTAHPGRASARITVTEPTPVSLSIQLFGTFEVQVNGTPLPRLRAHTGDALLALLTLRHNRDVERAWLAGTLLPDSSLSQGLATMRRYLTDLRRALGSEAWRLGSPTTLSLTLDLSGADCDVVAFDAAIAQGDDESLEQAVTLYRGPLLEGWDEEWVFEERQAREQAYLEALESLAAGALARGDAPGAERWLRRAVAVDPLREGAQRALMQALAQGGSYAAATQLYRDLRVLLHRELNAEPAPETCALYEAIRCEARRRAQGSPLSRSAGEGPTADEREPIGRNESLPSAPRAAEGTRTFLFTDVEASTRLWEQRPAEMRIALKRHDLLLRAAIESHGGHVFKTMGDQFCAVFKAAADAVAAALAAQRAVQTEAWDGIEPLRVRAVLHTGVAEERDGDYLGPTLNRTARLLEAGHGGQTLLSLVTQELARDYLPQGIGLRDMGEHRLKDLERPERVFQLLAEDLPADFPPLRTLSTLPNNLPHALTSFIGREREIAEVKQRLVHPHPRSARVPGRYPTRLLTLTGVGGTGKTRLSLQVATEVMAEYADGVWLMELAPLADPALVPHAVATVLSVREEPGQPLMQTLVRHLKAKHLLLMLDNCEHLLAACAQLADTILKQCPDVTILASSREGLAIAGESLYRVPSLSLPEPDHRSPGDPDLLPALAQSEAVQLFVDRAAAVRPGFALSRSNALAVVEICCRLDGIPLALELAAARVRALSVEQIASGMGDLFRLLTGGSRTALPRQQTLRAAIDWSYDLLSEPERMLLLRLSVFAGGWNLEAAEAVCSDGGVGSDLSEICNPGCPLPTAWVPGAIIRNEELLDLLTSLVDKSLVQHEERKGEARYRLLETVRQYGRDRLVEGGEAGTVRRRHLEWCRELAQRSDVLGPDQRECLERLDSELDNIRTGLEMALASEPIAALELAGGLGRFWSVRHWTEGRAFLERALLAASGAPDEARAEALAWAGRLKWQQGDYEAAKAVLRSSLELYRRLGDLGGVAFSLNNLGNVAWGLGEYGAARALHTECLSIWREVAPDKSGTAVSLNNLGTDALAQQDYEAARAAFEESLALSRQQGSQFEAAWALEGLGNLACAEEQYGTAQAWFADSLAVAREIGDKGRVAGCLAGLAQVAAAAGDAERAARLFGAAEALRQAIGAPIHPAESALYEGSIEVIRSRLGRQAFEAAWAEGRAMPPEEAMAMALEEEAGG
jgi:predicted ATPase/class 3 adenylate cyclase/Tfp pilus assembly protein PilF